MVRDKGDGSVQFLQIKEVVTQWDPIAMISYGIGVLPLKRKLRGSHTRVTQLWYADDAGAGGKFIFFFFAHLWNLQARGPPRGYFPEPTKSILVVAPRNVARAEWFFRGMGLKVVCNADISGGSLGKSRRRRAVWT